MFKDTQRERARSNKALAFTKSMNMDIRVDNKNILTWQFCIEILRFQS